MDKYSDSEVPLVSVVSSVSTSLPGRMQLICNLHKPAPSEFRSQ